MPGIARVKKAGGWRKSPVSARQSARAVDITSMAELTPSGHS